MANYLVLEDYLVILAMLLIAWGIGVAVACTQCWKKSSDQRSQYLIGNRKTGVLPAAFSIAVTQISSGAILGFCAEVYSYGVQVIAFALGGLVAILLSATFVIPVYRQFRYVSIYEYLEKRFSFPMRLSFSAFYILAGLAMNAVSLYAPALCLSTLTSVPHWVSILITGSACMFYCTMGGFKAIVWSDVMQSIFIVTSNILIIYFGILKVGGLEQVLTDGIEGRRLLHITLLDNEHTRYSVWALFFGGLLFTLHYMVAGQAGIQRALSVRGVVEAQSATILGGLIVFLFSCSTTIAAVVMYSIFAQCDSTSLVEEFGTQSDDQIYLYAIARVLIHPGLKGLALTGIISGSLSTVSSYLNALVALSYEDFISPTLLLIQRTTSDKTSLIICKLLTLIYGTLSIIMAFFVPYLGGITRTVVQFVGAIGGPQTAVILLGMFCTKANGKGALVGFILGLAFTMWMNIGSIYYQVHDQYSDKLPGAQQGCFDMDSDFRPIDNQLEYFVTFNDSITTLEYSSTYGQENTTFFNFPESAALNGSKTISKHSIFPLYRLTFMWYGTLGMLVTFFTGLVASEVIGNGNIKIDPRLISTLVGGCKTKRYERNQAVLMFKRDYPDESSIGNANDLQCFEDSNEETGHI